MTNENIVAEMKFNIELNFKITEKGKNEMKQGDTFEEIIKHCKKEMEEFIAEEFDPKEPDLIKYDFNIMSELIEN